MWTRSELKERAKNILRNNYWQALLVSIVIVLAGGGHGSSGGSAGRSNHIRQNFNGFDYYFDRYAWVVLLVILAIILIRIFLGYLLEVGGRKYFIQSASQDSDFSYLGFAFNGEYYVNVVLTMFYRAVLIFLWTLLFIIPGIIKSYAYRMVPYILADNPNIGYSRAVELSNQMTMDQKFDIFVLDLSFLGWYLVGTLAFFVGVIFVMPYQDATNAELYIKLRDEAIERGICSREELNIA